MDYSIEAKELFKDEKFLVWWSILFFFLPYEEFLLGTVDIVQLILHIMSCKAATTTTVLGYTLKEFRIRIRTTDFTSASTIFLYPPTSTKTSHFFRCIFLYAHIRFLIFSDLWRDKFIWFVWLLGMMNLLEALEASLTASEKRIAALMLHT